MIGEFVTHRPSPQFGSLNHRGSGQTQRFWAGPGWTLAGSKRTLSSRQSPLKPSKMSHNRRSENCAQTRCSLRHEADNEKAC
jgi:hypothetical protein